MSRDEIDDAMAVGLARVGLLTNDINRKIMSGEFLISDIQTATFWITELTNELDVLREQLQECGQ